MSENTILEAVNKLEAKRKAVKAAKDAEQAGIDAATERTAGFMENSGNVLESVPGAKGSGDVKPIITLSPVEKPQPKAVTRESTGA